MKSPKPPKPKLTPEQEAFKYKLSCEMKDFLLQSVGLTPRVEA